MSLPTVDQDLRTRVAPLHPDVVVLYPTPAQYLAVAVPLAASPVAVAETPPWYAVLRPRSVSRLSDQIKAMLPIWLQTLLRQRDIDRDITGQTESWRFTAIPDDRMASYDRDLRHAIGTIHGIGAKAVIMTHADLFMAPRGADGARRAAQLIAWQRSYPRALASVLPAFDSAAVGVTLRAAKDSSVRAVDLATAIRDLPPGAAADAFRDYAHFSDAGSAIVAGMLGPAVLDAERGVPIGTEPQRVDGCPDLVVGPGVPAAGPATGR
jgi:hypothetical protein